MNTRKIIEEVDKLHFRDIVKSSEIKVSPHALLHLSQLQRKVFKDSELIKMITNRKASGVGLQRNGRFAVFYRRKNGFRKIILAIKDKRIDIIKFMDVDVMPKLKRLKK